MFDARAETAEAAETLKVGVYANEPKIFVDAKGRASGILIDLLRAIAKEEGWQLEFVPCEWERCLQELRNGNIDLLPDVAYSDERELAFDFHRTPALHSWSQVYRNPSVPITSVFDLAGKRIAVLRGSIQERYFAAMLLNFGLDAVFKPVPTPDDAFRMVAEGRAEAAIVNNYYGDMHAGRHRLVDTPLVFQPARLFYAAANGRQPEVLAAIDRQLQTWQLDPGSPYFAVLRHWQGHSAASRMPSWLWWSLAALGALLLSALLAAGWLRRQVSLKTRDLRDSERMLSTIVDSVDSLIFTKDAQYRYQYVNRAMCRVFGKPAAEIIGKDDYALLDEASAALLRERDRRVLERGERVVAEERKALFGSGPVYLSTKIPLRGDDGRVYGLCGIATDITERKRTEDSLRLAAAVFQSQEGMFVIGPDKRVLTINESLSALSGFTAADLIGKPSPPIYLERNGPDIQDLMWEEVKRSGKWQREIWTRRKNGGEYPAWLTVTAVRDASGALTNFVGTQTDISERKFAQDEIMRLAYYDQLTGLPNRRLLLERLKHCLALQERNGQASALLVLDLDNFKDLNDTRGHEAGDELLRQVAARVVACARESDTVARLGGDEFVVLLEQVGADEVDTAAHVAAVGWKILDAIREPYLIAGSAHHTTCSIGATVCVDPQVEIAELMKRGDLAMYQAKKDGRDTLRFFHGDMQAAVSERIALETELREAIRLQQFLLHFQGQSDAQGRMTGAEALVRWQHPTRGLVGPDSFIGVAEASGLILPLGLWVLRTACTQLAAWSASTATARLTLAVNVSVHQFRQADFVQQTLAVLAETGADPGKLKLEITESLLIENVEDTVGKMRQLKEHGVGFSLDDFGTGYSSLSYLKRLPIDELKIDRSFVRDVLTDPNDASIARSIVALAKALGLGIIAEGVETEAQRAFLAQIGCGATQGYLFCRPMEAAALELRL